MKPLVLAAATLVLLAAPSLAQTPPAGGNCLFPLACPGSVPPKPEPLLGAPEDEAPTAQPAEAAGKSKHHIRKHAKPKA